MDKKFTFSEENDLVSLRRPASPKSSFAGLLIKLGLAKTERQANAYLILISLVCFGLIVYINLKTFGGL